MAEGDYITRAEFEEAINALRCYGDQQTIDVQQTPGGQVITSNQVLTEGAAGDESYLVISYDSDLQRFTISISSLPVVALDYGNSITSTRLSAESATLVFNKPGSNQTLNLYLLPVPTSSTNRPYILWKNASLTASDTDTEGRETTVTDNWGYNFARIVLKTDGTWTTTFDRTTKTPIYVKQLDSKPNLYVNTGTKTVTLSAFWNELQNAEVTTSLAYSEPVDDTLILGFNNGSTSYTLDLSANFASYNEYITIGDLEIDASNVVKKCILRRKNNSSLGILGWTGTFPDNNGKTVSVSNGIIYNKTV